MNEEQKRELMVFLTLNENEKTRKKWLEEHHPKGTVKVQSDGSMLYEDDKIKFIIEG